MRVQFKDFWGDFDHHDNFFTDLLNQFGYNFSVVDESPDVVMFSVFGKYQQWVHLSRGLLPLPDKGARKVFYTGEALRRKKWLPFVIKKYHRIKSADLNLTFDNRAEYNNIRLPLWLLYYCHISTSACHKDMTLYEKNAEKFCCFIYSHDVKYRNQFCKKLSQYKKVDCAGRCLNNVAEPLGRDFDDKLNFQSSYKFCIAYENCSQPGYTTEKILDTYKSNCIPIYYGSETVTDDFNPDTFINAHDFDSEAALIEYIKEVDNDDKLYQSFLNKPIFSEQWLRRFNDPHQEYFRNIAMKLVE